MDYKEKLISLINDETLPIEQRKKLEEIYNSCIHTEEERIIKAQLDYWRSVGGKEWHGVPVQETIAWLEKQKTIEHFELKEGHWYVCHRAFCCRADHLTIKEGEKFMCEKDGVAKGFIIKDPEKYFKETVPPAPYEDEQGEQKSIDKVEPKFKVGDYIKHNKVNVILKIISVNSGSYYVENIETSGRIELFNAEQYYHLWTIQDAKDGDVLAGGDWVFIFRKFHINDFPKCHCHYDLTLEEFKVDTDSYMAGGGDNYPATKEQRDLLFEKMHETGYEWDENKKELRKIEEQGGQKSAWSEEVNLEKEIDEYMKSHHLYIKYGGRIVFENDDTPNFMCDFHDIAKHFFEFGLKTKKG